MQVAADLFCSYLQQISAAGLVDLRAEGGLEGWGAAVRRGNAAAARSRCSARAGQGAAAGRGSEPSPTRTLVAYDSDVFIPSGTPV